ncbi:hypothetical protein BGZ90_008821 [Linnemannia elongata]|nr:hypothetical protein BGZ90_008821 [Linnemannia elongata]
MTTESMLHVDPSEAKSTSEIDTNWITSKTHKDGDSVLLQEDIANTDPSTLESLTILNHEPAMPETKIRNATKLCLVTPGNDHQHQAKDIVATAPCTPDKLLTSKQGTLSLSPITPIPVVVTTGIRSRRPSPIVTTGRHASNDDTAGQEDRITLVTAEDYSTEQSPTECPAFDPASLADFITEHRSTTVKKFHGIIQQLDAVNAELQWMLSEYLSQQYEQIEEIVASSHKNIAQQEKDQELLQEQILSFLNAMKSAFAIFGEKDS